MGARKARKGQVPGGVAKKTQHLIESEGKTPEQAYATAWSMHRAGRLTSKGEYKRKR